VARLLDLCQEALALDGGARAAFLDRACAGDADLRHAVQALLAEESHIGEFLETPTCGTGGRRIAEGEHLGPYEILALVGAGAMGEVYKARDTRLGRTVAIKVLPADLAFDPARRERFRREGRAVSALNHAHICTLYDIGSDGGLDYLVMEYLEGETLAARLASGPVPLGEALEYASQTADALANAHARGVIHRDLKPGNVIITASGAKLLDFGIAKLDRDATRSNNPSLTAEGLVVGTIAYMAPEQLRGMGVDARSDIFSFGAMLFEMVTGRRAFQGASQMSVIAAILEDDPPVVSALQPATPPAVDDLVRRCLAKDATARWQSAADIAEQLRLIVRGSAAPLLAGPRPRWLRARGSRGALIALGAIMAIVGVFGWWNMYFAARPAPSTPTKPIRSLAVLPLANLSNDAGQEFLADSLHDALIGTFAEITQLTVTSRTSVMHHAERRAPVGELARALSVDGVIEGAVQRTADNVLVTVRMIDPASDRVIANASAERPIREIRSLSREVARKVVTDLGLTLTPDEVRRLQPARPVIPAAYEALAKGLFIRPGADESKHRQRLALFQQAIALDPEYAEAYAALGAAWERTAVFGYERPSEAAARAKAAVLKALALDDMLPQAHASLGTILLRFDHDWPAAERAFVRALALNPNDTAALEGYWQFLTIVCRHAEAIDVARHELAVDPVNGDAALGWVLLRAGRPAEAAVHYERALTLLRPAPWRQANLAAAYSRLGKHAEATRQCDEAMRAPFGAPTHAFCANVYAAAGQHGVSAKIAGDLVERTRHEYVDPFFVGVAFLSLDSARSLDWFEKAYDDRSPNIGAGVRHTPWIQKAAGSLRLQNLITRLKLPISSSER
jgi:serine/threonine-protein kinase